jgi:glycosyltransferase involved in cell wall biosynthesis
MRMAYVVTRGDEIGGVHVHVRDLATALHRAGHEVTVLAGSLGPFADQLAERGISFRSVPALIRSIHPRYDVAALAQLRSCFKELRPDLISTHSSKAGWLGRLAAATLAIPVLFTAHGWAFTDGVSASQRRFYSLAEGMAAPLASHFITVSEHDRALALRHRIAPPDKVTCVHNGILDHAGAMPSRPSDRAARIVMVARFSDQKDHATLLLALSQLHSQAWSLDLVGAGPAQAEAKVLADSLGIADRVHFLGERDDVQKIPANADIFALITKWEGLPRSILEAMSAGLPVVASNVGGVSEAVVDGETGLLVPRGNPQIVARQLANLMDNANLRHALGAGARLRYEREFRFETMYARTLAVYRRFVAEI